MKTVIPETEVLNACRALFGPHHEISSHLLVSLRPADIKSAYRRRAKETHPDLFHGKGPLYQKRQTELFRAVLDSYNLVQEYFKQQEKAPRQPTRKPYYHPRPAEKPAAKPAAKARPAAADNHHPLNRHFNGTVPSFRMEIGRYLYYRGKITYQVLIKALSWQRTQRPVLGDLALRWGWLNQDTIRTILDFKGMPLLFGERGVHLGHFTPFQVRTLLAYQRTRQKRLGHYFVESGLISAMEMERLIADMQEHNAKVNAQQMRWKAG